MKNLPGRQIENRGGLKDEFPLEHSTIDRTEKSHKYILLMLFIDFKLVCEKEF